LHPTIDEQLEGIARLIERTADRHAADPSADRLRAAAGTLRRIAGSWAEVLPYLSGDNDAMVALLDRLSAELPDGAAARARALCAEKIDPLATRAVHDRNKALRGLLAEVVKTLPAEASAPRAAIGEHLRQRIARDPSSGRKRRPLQTREDLR